MSQILQDKFILCMLNHKRNGYFLEIGGNDPIDLSNTFVLERLYGWKGFIVEMDPSYEPMYRKMRPNSIPLISDARRIDYAGQLKKHGFPKEMDYLQIDLEVTNRSTLDVLELLNSTVFPEYTFSVVTFEHDIYRGNHYDTREKSRKIFKDNGYVLLFADVKNEGNAFEDWYIHPSKVTSYEPLITHESMEYDAVLSKVERTLYPSPKMTFETLQPKKDSEPLYLEYTRYIQHILELDDISNFKQSPVYKKILEHVDLRNGYEYLNLLQNSGAVKFSMEDLIALCIIVDRIGNPEMINWGPRIKTSPTNMRYAYHSHLILSHIKSLGLTETNIVEVGAGYGGLCSFIHYLSQFYGVRVNSYTLVDLKQSNMLQKKYLRSFPFFDTLRFIQNDDSASLSSEVEEKSFLISNYCFSEISRENQQHYIRTLFPKIEHGFMAWNYIPVYDFGFKTRVDDEIPCTGNVFNKYVYF